MSNETHLPILTSLIAGGIAGLTVDIALFPLDTLKTRLQSPCGFLASGGFKNLYKGLGTAAIGSVPTASLFFCTYNTIKNVLHDKTDPMYVPILHMGAASAGEIGSCLLKVPIEVVKQRQQAAKEHLSSLDVCKKAIQSEGYLGLYRGFTTTVCREIPFVLIQFPIWEWLKLRWHLFTQKEIGVFEVALCGALSGGIAAALTTPLDVAKTRIMLAEKAVHSERRLMTISTIGMLTRIYKNEGIKGLFAGFVPRTLWITLGGAVFFGAYQAALELCFKFDTLK